jgi:hypothetical protein
MGANTENVGSENQRRLIWAANEFTNICDSDSVVVDNVGMQQYSASQCIA